MKKSIKLIAAALAAVTAMSCTSATAFADKLKTVDGVTYKYSDSGERKGKFTGWAKNTKTGARFCYKKGVKQLGFVHIGKGWYYIDGKKGMLTGKQTINGAVYSFTKSGMWNKRCTYPDGTSEQDPNGIITAKLDKKLYCGLVYEDGMYVIMSVDGKAESAVEKLLPGLSGIMFRPVKNSLYELEAMREKLAEELHGKWYGNGVDYYKNKIVFDVDEKYLDEVQKYIEDNGYADYAAAEKGYPIVLD